jgi:hypothetical protein
MAAVAPVGKGASAASTDRGCEGALDLSRLQVR